MKGLVGLVVLATLAGCAAPPPQQVTPPPPVGPLTYDPVWLAGQERSQRLRNPQTPEDRAEAARLAEQDRAWMQARQAAAICAARGNMAAAMPAPGTMVAAIFSQEIARNQVARACWEGYQATGIMPGL